MKTVACTGFLTNNANQCRRALVRFVWSAFRFCEFSDAGGATTTGLYQRLAVYVVLTVVYPVTRRRRGAGDTSAAVIPSVEPANPGPSSTSTVRS